jgi:hypothetical protein
VGTQGQFASPSDSTVEGGPGLVLGGGEGSDSRLVPSEQLLPLGLLEHVLVVGVLVVLVGHGGGVGDVLLSTVNNLLSFVPSW